MAMLFFNIFWILLLSSCTDTKPFEKRIADLETENKNLKGRIEQLETENKQLKETDDYYWQSAINLLNDNNYDATVQKLNELRDKFPNTKLLQPVNKKLNDIDKRQKDLYAELLSSIEKAEDLDVKIEKIKTFLDKGFTQEYKGKAKEQLTVYEQQYDKIRKEKEFEKSTGIKIEQIDTSWEKSGSMYGLVHPFVRIKIKNISNQEISPRITIEYIKTGNKEIFDSATEYVGFIKPGYSRTAVVHPASGYKFAYFLPELTANISINGTFVKAVTVKRGF
jgi:hypothetical protein